MKEATIATVTITSADTEYEYEVPSTTVYLEVRLRDATAFRVAWVTGKVAAPTDDYKTIPAGYVYESPKDIDFRFEKILYIAAPAGTKVAEVEVWKEV